MKYIIFIFLLGVSGCTSTYTIQSKEAQFIPIENIADDKSIEDKIKPYRDSLSNQMNEVIGKSEIEMKTGQPESLLGNFVSDMLLNDFHRQTHIPTDDSYFVLLNFRGLRAPLHQGDITTGNIFEIMPFENAIVIAKLKGGQILVMCEYLKNYGGQPFSHNFNLKIAEDSTFTVMLNSKPIDENKIYHVITTDYLSGGGDNMTFFQEASIKETNLKLRDFIIRYIQNETKSGRISNSQLDERMKYE